MTPYPMGAEAERIVITKTKRLRWRAVAILVVVVGLATGAQAQVPAPSPPAPQDDSHERSARRDGPQSQSAPRKVERARRPHFTPRDWKGTFFDNLFRDGLAGQRPDDFGKAPAAAPDASASPPIAAHPDSAEGVWQPLIDAATLEDEIKRLNLDLEQQITTPTRFASDYGAARQSFSMLAAWFTIVAEYDGEVRWKADAPFATAAFARAAAGARVGSEQAYQTARRRKTDLANLIRGEAFPTDEKPDDDAWPALDRTALMTRLEEAYAEKLRPAVASAGDFRAGQASVLHEAQIVAAIAELLAKPAMPDAEDEGYTAYAKQLSTAATDAMAALKADNFQAVSDSVNRIDQACSACHEDWR